MMLLRLTEGQAGQAIAISGIIQLPITLGATLGGMVFDAAGAVPKLLFSGTLLAIAAIAAFMVARFHASQPLTERW